MTANSGGKWQEWLRRTPLWVLVPVIAAALTAVQLGTRLLRGKEVPAEDVLAYGAFGAATGIFTLWSAFRARAKERTLPPGSPTATNIRTAISTGQLPEEASTEQWEPEPR